MIFLRTRTCFTLSIIFHAIILLIFMMGFDLVSPLTVVENTHKKDVISAVILGDSPKSHILPQEKPPAIQQEEQPVPKPLKPAKQTQEEQIKKDILAKKVAAEKKALLEKNTRELLAKDLLKDIKRLKLKEQKKLKQKELESIFHKKLHEQAEKSLRQQLLDEKIKLKSKQMREAQGLVNKYTALIQQVVGDHWIVPAGVNKKLNCVLIIRLAPGGTVLDVQIMKTSGDPSLDSSARAAVIKASPLPVPEDPQVFEQFRQIILKVKPENIIAGQEKSNLSKL